MRRTSKAIAKALHGRKDSVSTEQMSLLAAMLEVDPEKRLGIDDVLAHEFWTKPRRRATAQAAERAADAAKAQAKELEMEARARV